MRILIFGWTTSVHICRWARGLTQRGHTVRVVSLGGDPIDGVDTVVIPKKAKLSYLISQKAAINAAREFDPDIVHAHYATGNAWWGVKSKLRPLVVSVWGTELQEKARNPIARSGIRRLLNKADHICATSRQLKDAVIKLQSGLEDRLSVIPFGVEIPDELYKMPDTEPFRICFVKWLHPRYAPEVLIEAFSKALRRFPKMILSMVGEGVMEQELKRQVNDLGIESSVEFTGWIENDQIYSFLKSQHLMVMPSRAEAFGVVALEAAACGRPTIATNVGGIPEVVNDGETGIIVPPDDVDAITEAILELAADPHRVEQMGHAAFKFAKDNYSWAKSLDITIELYERLIQDRNNKA